MEAVRFILVEYKEPISGLLYAVAAGVFVKLVHLPLREILHYLSSEFRDLLRVKFTVGSMNAAGLIPVVLIGIIVIGSAELHFLGALLDGLLGSAKAAEATDSSTMVVLFVVAVYALVSVWAVRRDDRMRMKRRRGGRKQAS